MGNRKIKSPCINICKLENDMCIGCLRSIDEIKNWRMLTDEEKDVIIQRVGEKKTGIVAGNFDVIHPGYMKMFKECKKHCDHFIVLLHDDPSLERPDKLKPVLSLDERIEILSGIRYIDSVITYKTEDDLLHLLTVLNPDVRFLGADYIGKRYTGWELAIPVRWIQRNHGWTTTKFKTLIAQSIGNVA